ncbi:MAG: GTPase ObgE [Pseudomonadales bacterium]|nr:GTPase ObgE [Candidatus Woesebacteria bacterium]MCB9801874.1 GTPase ObgE [Pseudomonadales bacterium]
MIDLVTLTLKGGDGGNGRVSFRREARVMKGGPNGGRGGDGGSVLIRASKHLATLKQYAGKTHFSAEDGRFGGRQKQTGKNGASLVLEVPLGTQVTVTAENSISDYRRRKKKTDGRLKRGDARLQRYLLPREGAPIPGREPDELQELTPPLVVAELLEDGQELLICQGGYGGRGNDSFKGPERTTPLIAEYGSFGEEKVVQLELKLLADVGLVGYPNVGKSTIVSSLTGASTKIGAYPFTTLEPHLGVLRVSSSSSVEEELVIADIPGLIEGASEGKGLGHDFLRHIENTRALWFVLALEEADVFDEQKDASFLAKLLYEQYAALLSELHSHNPVVLEKQQVVTVNKVDLYSEDVRQAITQVFTHKGIEVLLMSAATGEGVSQVKERVFEVVLV